VDLSVRRSRSLAVSGVCSRASPVSRSGWSKAADRHQCRREGRHGKSRHPLLAVPGLLLAGLPVPRRVRHVRPARLRGHLLQPGAQSRGAWAAALIAPHLVADAQPRPGHRAAGMARAFAQLRAGLEAEAARVQAAARADGVRAVIMTAVTACMRPQITLEGFRQPAAHITHPRLRRHLQHIHAAGRGDPPGQARYPPIWSVRTAPPVSQLAAPDWTFCVMAVATLLFSFTSLRGTRIVVALSALVRILCRLISRNCTAW
jgi:hypothetical protein